MDFKSLGAILQMQDRLAVEWYSKVAAEDANLDLLPDAILIEETQRNEPTEPDSWSL